MVRNFTLYNFGSHKFFSKAHRFREKRAQSLKDSDWSNKAIPFLRDFSCYTGRIGLKFLQ